MSTNGRSAPNCAVSGKWQQCAQERRESVFLDAPGWMGLSFGRWLMADHGVCDGGAGLRWLMPHAGVCNGSCLMKAHASFLIKPCVCVFVFVYVVRVCICLVCVCVCV